MINEEDDQDQEGGQPGTEPSKQFIQTTFVHRDINGGRGSFSLIHLKSAGAWTLNWPKALITLLQTDLIIHPFLLSDEDREFAHFVQLKLAELRPRLYAQAHVTVDNENIDCSDDGSRRRSIAHPRCREYPLKEHFHFLVVEDS